MFIIFIINIMSVETTSHHSSGRNTPTKDETPQFCKRIDIPEMVKLSQIETHDELINIGKLMAGPSPKSDDLPKIKTMSLDQLHEYVEKKLSKPHYSPEVIYLLFQIQSLLLEKENLKNNFNTQSSIIIELKKDLISEKTLNNDLKDNIRENTSELDEIENEKNKEIKTLNEKYKILTTNYQTLTQRKNLYEKILIYLVPSSVLVVSIFINYLVTFVIKLFY